VTEQGPALDEIFGLLDRVHRPKDRAYRDAWRKRGEVLGIFANIARKYDRLVVALDEEAVPGTEALGDTVADLAVYAGKYATWLAETQPEVFRNFGISLNPAECAAAVGPDSLTAVFAAITQGVGVPAIAPVDVPQAFQEVSAVFLELEELLMAQAEGAPSSPADQKLSMALRLTWASGWLLVRLIERDPHMLDELEIAVAAMEQGSQS
jgi:hypothetical protein